MPGHPLLQLVLVVLAAGAGAARAQAAADPLKSSACLQALERLDTARGARSPETERLRQAAAGACLGAPAPQQPAARAPQPAFAVSPVELPAGPPPPGPALRPSPPVRNEAPAFATQCDAGGCWDTQGQRLPRTGTHLQGPRGPCLPQGTGFVCP